MVKMFEEFVNDRDPIDWDVVMSCEYAEDLRKAGFDLFKLPYSIHQKSPSVFRGELHAKYLMGNPERIKMLKSMNIHGERGNVITFRISANLIPAVSNINRMMVKTVIKSNIGTEPSDHYINSESDHITTESIIDSLKHVVQCMKVFRSDALKKGVVIRENMTDEMKKHLDVDNEIDTYTNDLWG
jgi:hypothetical protein